MENRNDGSKLVGRRRSLQLLGFGLAGGAFLLEACSKDSAAPGDQTPTDTPKPTAAPQSTGSGQMDCNAAIDDASRALRRTTQYKDKAVVPEKHCSACAQYISGKYGDCGGCKLFTGPVQPGGGCLSFAPAGEAGVGAPPANKPM